MECQECSRMFWEFLWPKKYKYGSCTLLRKGDPPNLEYPHHREYIPYPSSPFPTLFPTSPPPLPTLSQSPLPLKCVIEWFSYHNTSSVFPYYSVWLFDSRLVLYQVRLTSVKWQYPDLCFNWQFQPQVQVTLGQRVLDHRTSNFEATTCSFHLQQYHSAVHSAIQQSFSSSSIPDIFRTVFLTQLLGKCSLSYRTASTQPPSS